MLVLWSLFVRLVGGRGILLLGLVGMLDFGLWGSVFLRGVFSLVCRY